MGKVSEEIERRLRAAFDPLQLTVIDQSAHHAGHAGARPGGETHFLVEVVSAAFEGKSRVARQRDVHAALNGLFRERVHALTLRARSPTEVRPATPKAGGQS